MRGGSDEGVSSVIGAILVLAIVMVSIVYVNAFHVPNQGAAMEVGSRAQIEDSLMLLASSLQAASPGPITQTIPLSAPVQTPPLLSPIVLSPFVASGRLAFVPNATLVTISHVTNTSAGGVPGGDPIRVDLGGGKMRVYDLGNATSGFPVGSFQLVTGAAYLEPATYVFEAGALMVDRQSGSASIAPAALQVGSAGAPSAPLTSVSWRVPLLAGAANEIAGSPDAQVSLAPGLESRVGGGDTVFNVTISVSTSSRAAWTSGLTQIVGARGVVTNFTTAPDAGFVNATILPPAGAPAGMPSVSLDLRAIRYVVDFTAANAG